MNYFTRRSRFKQVSYSVFSYGLHENDEDDKFIYSPNCAAAGVGDTFLIEHQKRLFADIIHPIFIVSTNSNQGI